MLPSERNFNLASFTSGNDFRIGLLHIYEKVQLSCLSTVMVG